MGLRVILGQSKNIRARQVSFTSNDNDINDIYNNVCGTFDRNDHVCFIRSGIISLGDKDLRNQLSP